MTCRLTNYILYLLTNVYIRCMILIATCICFAACGNKITEKSVVGTYYIYSWSMDGKDLLIDGKPVNESEEFDKEMLVFHIYEDKTFKYVPMKNEEMALTGTWTLEDKTLTIVSKESEYVPVSQTMKLVFESKDTFSLSVEAEKSNYVFKK